MNRFLVFAWYKRFIPPGPSHNSPTGYWKSPRGGFQDFIIDVDTISDLDNLKLISEKISEYDECQIVDSTFPKYATSNGTVCRLFDIQNKPNLIDYIIENTIDEETIDVRKFKFN